MHGFRTVARSRSRTHKGPTGIEPTTFHWVLTSAPQCGSTFLFIFLLIHSYNGSKLFCWSEVGSTLLLCIRFRYLYLTWAFFFSDSVLLLHPTFVHVYLYFLIFTLENTLATFVLKRYKFCLKQFVVVAWNGDISTMLLSYFDIKVDDISEADYFRVLQLCGHSVHFSPHCCVTTFFFFFSSLSWFINGKQIWRNLFLLNLTWVKDLNL